MACNIIMRTVTLTASYQPVLAADDKWAQSAFTGVLSCPPSNTGSTTFKTADDAESVWIPSEWHNFTRVSLANLEVKGTVGDKVFVIGDDH